MSRTKTNAEFVEQLRSVNAHIIPEEEYINNHTPLLCHCEKCGNHWSARPNALLRGYGCPKCAGNYRKSNEEFLIELSSVNPDIVPLEPYQGNKKTLLCKCKKCNNEWKVSPNNLLSKGHKCPKCSHIQRGLLRRKSDDDFINELWKKNPNIQPLDAYITSQKKIRCRCLTCGFIWSAIPNNLLDKGSRCPNCSHCATSTIEQILIGSFACALGEKGVLSRDKRTIGKELDVLLPEKRLAIEFGAWFWHKYRISKDNEKQKLCKEKDIHLITIFEDCPTVITDELIGDYRIFQEELSNEEDYATTKKIIKEICIDYAIPFSVIDHNWDSIVKNALVRSQKRNHAEFQTMSHSISPTITLLEKYSKSNIKILCKCTTCGNEWRSLPTSLLSGCGCPKCARTITGEKIAITNEKFLFRLSQMNSNIEPLEPYVRGNNTIQCQCRVCGNIWNVKPKNLLSGKGCPKCGRARTTKLQSKPIRCVETGICYESVSDAHRKTGIYGVHKCANGQQKTAGGYHWEYIEAHDTK